MTESHIRNVIEAALLAAGKSLQPAELVELFDEDGARPSVADVQAVLAALAEEYSTRGIELKETATGFRIQVRPGLSNEISRLWPERPPKYSRALLETLAIIAYRQPITRAEIEAVRGVAVNPNIVKTVIERNWVHVVGHRDVPGRPELLGTTRDFLDYFGLKRLDELPPLAEIKAIGEIKMQFDLPDPAQLPPIGGAVESDAAVGSEAVATADADDGAKGEATGAADPSGEVAVDNASADVTAGAAADVSESPVAATDSSQDDVPAAEVSAESSPPEATTAAATAPEDPLAASATPESSVTEAGSEPAESQDPKPTGRGPGRKKKKGAKARAASDTALHEAEEFAASVDADLASDDDNSDEDELSAAGPDSSELVAGPRDIDD